MKILLLNIILLISSIGNSQSIKKYVKENFNEVKSINPLDTVYEDLKIIGEAIGESKIVFLGEQEHGDTKTIDIKIRLIKYLHEKHGFNVLAFESDFFALNQCSPENSLENIHGVWKGCNQHNILGSYIHETLDSKNPIQVTGFDCRHHSSYSKQHLVNDLDSIFHIANIPFIKSKNYNSFQSSLEHILQNEYESKIDSAKQKLFYSWLDTIQTQLRLSQFDSKDFWKQELLNLEQMVNNSLSTDLNETVFSNIRDRQMAENLLWLTDTKFKNEKIIVWAASFHIAKNVMKIEDFKTYVNDFENEDLVTMGDLFNKRFIGESYFLGFTSYEGTYRYGVLKAPSRHSFESILYKEGYDYGFINFKNCKSFKPFMMNGTNHVPYKSDWSKNFDGIFYIREMNSCYNKKKHLTKPKLH